MRSIRFAALVLALSAAGAAAQTAAPAGPVVGTCNFSPVVANLEQAVAFYSQAIGLPVGPVQTIGAANVALLDIHGTPRAAMRWAAARLPGGCGVEIVEFGGVDRTPFHPGPLDAGATTLVLEVRDLTAALARAAAAGARVVSAGGDAVDLGAGHAALLADPDGHYVELMQGNPNLTPSSGDVVAWHPRLVVSNGEAAAALYRTLGFTVQPAHFEKHATFNALNGVRGKRVRIQRAELRSETAVELVDVQGAHAGAIRTRVQDPGAARFQLRVTDLDSVTRAVTAAGGRVISTDGHAFSLPAGRGRAIQAQAVRDPNGLTLVLIKQ